MKKRSTLDICTIKKAIKSVIDQVYESLPHNIFLTQKIETFLAGLIVHNLNELLEKQNDHFFVNELYSIDIIEFCSSNIITIMELKYLYTYNLYDGYLKKVIKDALEKLTPKKKDRMENKDILLCDELQRYLLLHFIHPKLSALTEDNPELKKSLKWLNQSQRYFTYIYLTKKKRQIPKKFKKVEEITDITGEITKIVKGVFDENDIKNKYEIEKVETYHKDCLCATSPTSISRDCDDRRIFDFDFISIIIQICPTKRSS